MRERERERERVDKHVWTDEVTKTGLVMETVTKTFPQLAQTIEAIASIYLLARLAFELTK